MIGVNRYVSRADYTGCPEMNRTYFNRYNSILLVVNKLIIRLYTNDNNSANKILSVFNIN